MWKWLSRLLRKDPPRANKGSREITMRRSRRGGNDIEVALAEALVPRHDEHWGVRVYDVPELIATSTDPQCAANSVSFFGDDGRSFASAPNPEGSIPVDLRYRTEGPLRDGALFMPDCMDHKWAIYVFGSRILFIRSWTRKVQAVAEFEQHEAEIRVTRLHGPVHPNLFDDAFQVRALDFLIRSHALREVLPAPVPSNTPEPQVGLAAFSIYGKLARTATLEALPARPPEAPLRSYSALHLAATRGDLENVRELLAEGYHAGIRSPGGETPLHWWIHTPTEEVLRLLIASGADPDAPRDPDGSTPLMLAVQQGGVESLAMLIRSGADPNRGDARGFTALHRAAEIGNLEQVRTLLQAGSSPSASAEGHTPRSLAEMRGHAEVVGLLAEAEAARGA